MKATQNLNSRVEQTNTGSAAGDLVKYVLALLLVAAGIFAFYKFGHWATVVRVLVVLASLGAAGLVFMMTAKGAQTREFFSESRFELRKVVWPTRQETMRTTWVVIAVVILISLILAGFDLAIMKAVELLLGAKAPTGS